MLIYDLWARIAGNPTIWEMSRVTRKAQLQLSGEIILYKTMYNLVYVSAVKLYTLSNYTLSQLKIPCRVFLTVGVFLGFI